MLIGVLVFLNADHHYFDFDVGAFLVVAYSVIVARCFFSVLTRLGEYVFTVCEWTESFS